MSEEEAPGHQEMYQTGDTPQFSLVGELGMVTHDTT